ncbi:sugar phosphate isomerase/epimerase family protein [Terrilactibacillus laevilacticus]|uniref:sugar phosphate isomerase/epimerase family protein n=1 Tax=Terrilactibacillus laevilacticus TaxID=1380157 RepID=UPI001146EA62|nr:sugar phosphate isomerase/epimerase family protein [Terrilactibacillus laevilacticus]
MIPSTFPFSYGVNEFTTQPWSFEQDIVNYKSLGVDTIELCEIKLDPARMTSQLEFLRNSGLKVSSVQPQVRTAVPSMGQPHPERIEDRIKRFRQSIERLAPYTPGAVFVTNTGPAPKGNMVEAIQEVVKYHQDLSSIADYHGVKLALEPLNPILLNLETAIWTYKQALNLVQMINRDNVGICLDLWNLWQDAHLIRGINSSPEQIFLLQVSDWRTPRSSADRRSVGTGEIPTDELLHAVYNAGYRGPCVLEIFSQNVPDSLYNTDLNKLILDNRAALEQAWKSRLKV